MPSAGAVVTVAGLRAASGIVGPAFLALVIGLADVLDPGAVVGLQATLGGPPVDALDLHAPPDPAAAAMNSSVSTRYRCSSRTRLSMDAASEIGTLATGIPSERVRAVNLDHLDPVDAEAWAADPSRPGRSTAELGRLPPRCPGSLLNRDPVGFDGWRPVARPRRDPETDR